MSGDDLERVDAAVAVPEELSAGKLIIVLDRAYRSLAAYIGSAIALRGLYLGDFAVLEVLLHKGPLTSAAIAEKTPLTTGSLAPTVRRLQGLGLIRRRRTRDGKISIELTGTGQRLIGDTYIGHVADLERAFAPLSRAERLELHHAVKKIGLHAEQLQRGRFPDQRGGLAAWQLRRATRSLETAGAARQTVAQIAATLNLSPSQFSRAFKASTGMPPHRWQLSRRVAQAQELLQYGGQSIAQIALATGFAEQSHFSRVFQKVVGVSPGTWQRDHRN